MVETIGICLSFAVENHGVPATTIESAFQVSREFFALPAEEKLKIDAKNNTGYK
jgi:isopenicillin N synthase-like dioxygenase